MKKLLFVVPVVASLTGLFSCSGSDGAPGATGPAGPIGADGARGTGGASGAVGAEGEAGAPGAAGEAGTPGPQGDAGPQGPAGDAGPSGLNYVSTVVVSPTGAPTANGTALIAAMQATSGTAQAPKLVKIEPGQYDLGSQALFMKSNVDVEGSGEGVTTISSTGNAVLGADHAELRFVTVTSTGSNTFQNGVGVTAATIGFRMTHVTSIATGSGSFAYAFTGHGTLTNCTLTAVATGGAVGAGMFDNSNSNSTLVDSTVTGTNFSVQIQSGSVNMASTELAGPVSSPANLGLTCVACYDTNFAALGANCR